MKLLTQRLHRMASSRTTVTLLMALTAMATLAGCQPAGRVDLLQPQMTGWQREVQLITDQAHWARSGDVGKSADAGGGVDRDGDKGKIKGDRLLARFPLPGGRTGRPTYLLYLRLPNNVAKGMGKAVIDPSAEPASRTSGFLIQTRGENARVSRFVSGQVKAAWPFLVPANQRTFKIDVQCEDGTRIVGKILAFRDDYRITRFETKQYPAEVQSLLQRSTINE